MNIINEFFVSFILIKLYFKFKVCRKIKFPLLWKFYFSKWKFYFSADTSDNFTYKKENVDFAVLKMSKISLNKSANLSKDLNLIEKNSGDGGDFMNTRIHFGIVVKVENVIIQKVKASFLIVRVMSTLQEREVVL